MLEITNLSDNSEKRRTAVVAGIFYPETEAEIRKALQTYRSMQDETEVASDPLVLIVPHAAWDIAGPLLARAFNQVKNRSITQVVLIGPLHEWHEEGVFLSDSSVFETPLGDISVNLDKVDELLSCTTALEINDIPHLAEHSLEVLLPWVQITCPGASIVPILIGAFRTSHIHSLSRALEISFGEELDKTLFVITTNLSAHYDDNEAFEQSRLFLELIRERKANDILSFVKSFRISACGAAGVAAFLGCNFSFSGQHSLKEPLLLGQASARTDSGMSASGLAKELYGGPYAEPDRSVHYAALSIPMP
ncbi:AmmeMemoRadiSam system protein B [Gracilinema caldarium]|uniref:AmmeMemoRadiSam system protein B n=1 Tax=Gracilinema caldarium TaxID=215591 RepID=UPI0026EE66CB|nr:AmmeMemoRadiSam system protein B [Gracilinema caldarium]